MRKPAAAAVTLLALVASASAFAGPVGSGTQFQMKEILDSMGSANLEYMPTYVPPAYALFTTHVTQTEFGATFTSTKYPEKSAAFQTTAIYFATKPVGKNAACTNSARVKIKVKSKTIYWNGLDAAWQCLRAPDGRLVAVSAVSAKAGEADLVAVAASAARFT